MILIAVFECPDVALRAHEVGRVHQISSVEHLERNVAARLMSTVKNGVAGGLVGAATTMWVIGALWPQPPMLLYADAGFVGLIAGISPAGARAFRTTPTFHERCGPAPNRDELIVLVEVDGSFDQAVARLATAGGRDIRRLLPQTTLRNRLELD